MHKIPLFRRCSTLRQRPGDICQNVRIKIRELAKILEIHIVQFSVCPSCNSKEKGLEDGWLKEGRQIVSLSFPCTNQSDYFGVLTSAPLATSLGSLTMTVNRK